MAVRARSGRRPWPAIGRADGSRRALLVATCVALALAAVGDEATGYDGPGPFVYLAVAVLVALVPWRFTPLLATAMSVLFLYGGFASAAFRHQISDPGAVLGFAAGWLQTASFVAAAIFAVGAIFARNKAVPTVSR